MCQIILSAALLLASLAMGAAAQPSTPARPVAPETRPAMQTIEITIDPKDALPGKFLGLGAQWDASSYDANGVSSKDFSLVRTRLRWMQPPVLRVMMQTKWIFPDGRQLAPDTPAMKAFYRHLDHCQQQGITVFLTDWGCEPEWLQVPGIRDVADPAYAERIGQYLDYLLRKRGYSCIRYFILVNEPNFEVRDWDRWKTGLRNVREQLRLRGLDRQIALAGPDSSGADEWLDRAAEQLAAELPVYDIHYYASREDVRASRLAAYFRTRWDGVIRRDPVAKDKVLLVGEAGLWSEGAGAADNPLHLQYEYGLDMADYAVQALSAGSSAVLAWMLDDNSHTGFTWGMWSNRQDGMTLKPWFYSWALMTRLLPAGATLIPVASPSPDLRILAAKLSASSATHPAWTFVLVNRSSIPQSLRLRVAGQAPARFRTYHYSRDTRKADLAGFPLPTHEAPADLGTGIVCHVPAEAAIWLTSTTF